MNLKKIQFPIVSMLLSVLVAAACTSESPSDNPGTPPSGHTPVSLLDSNGTQQLLTILQSYYGLKDALTADDATTADRYTRRLITDIGTFPYPEDSLLADEVGPLLVTTDSALRAIAAANDESCEYQRVLFKQVSDNLLLLVQTTNLRHVTIYKQYCPMAFNDRGAYWLSEDPEIKNPYFGRKMAECGEISDTRY